MKSNYLCSIAVFLIVLIVSIPIYSSIAFASLTNPSLKGEDNIEGYVREDDTILINVNAKIDDDSEIEPSQVRLFDQTGPPFSICNNIGEKTFNCQFITPTTDIATNPFVLNIKLYRDDNVEDSSIIVRGAKDISAPRITSLTINPILIGNGNIQFNYKIEDFIYNGSSGRCSGIKNLIITSGIYSKIININSAPGSCIKEGSFTEKVDAITSLTSGDVTVEARAYDAFNQESDIAITTFTVDKTPPEIELNSFRLFDSNNNEIRYISKPITASASININEPNIASVLADFSSLKPSNGIIPAVCNNGNCIWNNIAVELSSGGSFDIIINTTDSLGNSKIETISYLIELDNTVPLLTLIKTNHFYSGNSYLGKSNNTIIVEIDEAGSGFNNKNMYLNLREINNNENLQANNCSKEDNIWRCYWSNIGVISSDGNRQISIKPDSIDDLGNLITGTPQANVIVDKTNPVIGEISYTPKEPKSGDTIIFTFNAQDTNAVIPKIDSSLISTTPIFTGNCNNNSCAVSVTDLVSSYTQANVKLIAEDVAGNKAIKEHRVIIYQSDSTIMPNFFTVNNIEIIPSRIDRKVASQLPLYVYVHIPLQAAGSGKIVSMTPDCIEMMGALSEQPYIMNEYSNDPYIVLKTNPSIGMSEGNLPIKCKLRLNVRDDRVVYSNYEEERISTQIEMYGNAMGDMDDSLNEKLSRTDGQIQKLDKQIKSYEKWVKTWGTYCKIAEGLGKLNTVLQALKSAAWIILSIAWFACLALAELGVAAVASCQKPFNLAWAKTCTALSEWHSQIIEKYIWPTGYVTPFWWAVIYSKAPCMIAFHCALCDWNTVADVATGIAVYSARKNVGSTSTPSSNTYPTLRYTPDSVPKLAAVLTKPEELQNLRATSINEQKNIGLNKMTGRVADKKTERTAESGDSTTGGSSWKTTGEQTKAMSGADSWMFDPYKSIHYAKACLCLPAIVYNLKKKRQIECMYRNCLKKHIGTGISVTACDVAHKERDCLYVESAQFKKHGYLGSLFDTFTQYVLENAPYLAISIAYLATCWKYITTPTPWCVKTFVGGVPFTGRHPVACGLWGSTMSLVEMYQIFASKFSFLNYGQDLKGEDYCESGN